MLIICRFCHLTYPLMAGAELKGNAVKLSTNDLNCVDVALNPTHSLTFEYIITVHSLLCHSDYTLFRSFPVFFPILFAMTFLPDTRGGQKVLSLTHLNER